jgi:1-phosphatidylinositol-3-phosphate 5-kinase
MLTRCSIADIVKRFQPGEDSSVPDEAETLPVTRTHSSRSLHRSHSHRSRVPDASDSDIPQQQTIRPRLRRGKTDQPPTIRAREKVRPELASDAERSYAHNASRLLQPTITRRATEMPARPISRRTNTNPSPAASRGTSPERGIIRSRSPAPSMARRPTSSSIESVKPRIAGKGKAVASDIPAGRVAPSMSKATTRRMLGTPGTRVTSIARHFDRLSREAERERQKRVSNNRVKRARPVTVTKAKVQVFDNLRDAFKDEFDTDSSSEADNEEDDEVGGYESTDSKPGSKASSPTKSRQSSPKKKKPILSPESVAASTTDAAESESHSTPDYMGISASSNLATVQSGFSDHRSERSYTDRLQIELPSFETSAPLPSMPVTPQMSNTDTADEGGRHMTNHMSESEMSSGPERSSIIKTLTGLWAFRAGEFTPLEYPLCVALIHSPC